MLKIMKPEAIFLEDPIMDLNLLIDELPETDGFAKLHDYSWQGGGNISSAAVAAARLGARTAVAGVIGNDAFGAFCKADFKRHGIDVSHLVTDPDGRTTFVICLAEQKKMGRSILGKGGKKRLMTDSEIDKDFIASAKYLHLGHMGPTQIKAARWARAAGVTVVNDAGSFSRDTDEHTNLIDVFIASEHYYKGLFSDEQYEDNMRTLQKRGPHLIIVTLGKRGCVGLDGDTFFEIPAYDNLDIVDTTGAGDVFHGAFIFALLQGWPAKQCAQFSSAVSAIKCTRLGGRAAIPDYETVIQFMEDGSLDFSEIDERVIYYRDGLTNSLQNPEGL